MSSRILGLCTLRPVGPAELSWRSPLPDEEKVLQGLGEELRALEMVPRQERRAQLRRLLLEWHPDKNAHRLSLATAAFQFLQANKALALGK